MGTNDTHRRTLRRTAVEPLEERLAMSASALAGLSAEAAASLQTAPRTNAATAGLQNSDVDDALLAQHGGLTTEAPTLANPLDPDADFWLDARLDNDIEQMLGEVQQALSAAHQLSGLAAVRGDYGFSGAGQTVAVIDSGIAWDHPALGGGLGPNYRVVGGWDFAENDANPYDDGPAGSHGTHVSGIVGADRSGTASDGVAPGVDLVSLRVFDDSGAGSFAWVESALRWVHEHRNSFANPITAVNLSLGTTWNSNSVPLWSTLEDELAQLKADGIFVSVSAGNNFVNVNRAQGLSYPAASPSVVPVMSVDENGALSSFSQRHPRAIAAPGRYIMSTVPDYTGNHNGQADDFASYSGTSMAAPYVAGASVLVREAMQFVGYATITQDTIFAHMLATADILVDTLTSQSYKRLNLNNALAALMPADEFGSTAAEAHDLGQLGGQSTVSGMIGTASDADFFRFTAASSGTVTFTATTTNTLTPQWSGSTTGRVSGARGESFSLDVVAGQSYAVGLATGAGIGRYELVIDAASDFAFVDWGKITQTNKSGVGASGAAWYRVEAGRTGDLTVEALFQAAGGNVDLALYDSNLRLVASGKATPTGARADLQAVAGGTYFLRIDGANPSVDVRLTNLVTTSGGAIHLAGTSGVDQFAFATGASGHTVTVNGAVYQFDRGAFSRIEFDGGAGSDVITITGTAASETATFRAGQVTFAGAGYSVAAASIENVTIRSGGGADVANFNDTAGDDVFTARPTTAVMTGPGYSHTASGFARTLAVAAAGGFDNAYLHDGATNDRLFARPTYAMLQSTTGEFSNYAGGFDRVFAYAAAGGADDAYLYDSAASDRLVARPNDAALYSIDNQYYNYAASFDRVFAYASTGNDDAYLYDGATNDRLVTRPQYAVLQSTTGEFYNYANGFDRTFAYATAGGSDDAYFYDGSGNDRFVATPAYASMYDAGTSYYNYANSFDRVFAYATAGGNDEAVLYDGGGNDRFVGRPEYALLHGANHEFYNYAASFERVQASATGGHYVAYLYDSAADDRFVSRTLSAEMYAANQQYYIRTTNFDAVFATASTGYDLAWLYDSAGDDALVGRGTSVELNGDGYRSVAAGFDRVTATSVDGRDSVDIVAVDFLFEGLGKWA